ncbi:hypothetical protein F5884DRAFT_548583 [Xylogone sp. PMI_703]|nr:hypothetical protein F5884DRAFT_548583 [Xylogone sp. PMI_703]
MIKSMILSAIPVLMLANGAYAVCGIHSFTSCDDNIVHWFDPNTGEVCDPLDCGGGRAPPKTDVPGCPLYTGTETPTTSYLSCWTPTSALASSTLATSVSASPTTSIVTSTAPSTSSTSSSTSSSAPSTSIQSTQPTTTPSVTPPASLSTQPTAVSTTPPVTPSVTPSAGLSSAVQPSGNGTLSTSGISSPPQATPNAGSFLDGSLMAVAGAAIGVMAMVY